MKTNTRIIHPKEYTAEGAPASIITPEMALRRSVMACMLWEDTFYEDGVDIAARIQDLVPKVAPGKVHAIAVEARTKMKLRHAPLLLAREMARYPKHKELVAFTLSEIIQRPDELSEFLSIYWKEGKCPIARQVKKGLASAFMKFNEYQLAKYNRDAAIKLRDVMFMVHPKPRDDWQASVWKRLAEGTLATPDTWEVELSAGQGENKKESWERLLKEGKLGALALLRNLRNMYQVGVDSHLVFEALDAMNVERVLPFRFIAAARAVPQWEDKIEPALFRCVKNMPRFQGTTAVLVDVSGSMDSQISGKSDIRGVDAACGVAMLVRELADVFALCTFSNSLVPVPPRRGFALRDAILHSQYHGGTQLGMALEWLYVQLPGIDRLIVITDEQSHDRVPAPQGRGYMINVAPYRNGVGYGAWTHIDGWSEAVLDYIQMVEQPEAV